MSDPTKTSLQAAGWVPLAEECSFLKKEAARLEADNARLREALADERDWHDQQDRALSKSGRGDTDYYYRRSLHQDKRDMIDAALQQSEQG